MPRGGYREGSGRKKGSKSKRIGQIVSTKTIADIIRETFGFKFVEINNYIRKNDNITFDIRAIVKENIPDSGVEQEGSKDEVDFEANM